MATAKKSAKLEKIVFPCLTLESVISKDELLSKGTIIERHVLNPNKNSSKIFCDLNYMNWYLEWGKADVQSDMLLSLALKFDPQPEFADKIDNVVIMLAFSIYSGDFDNKPPVGCISIRNTIQLTKKTDYRFKMIRSKKKLDVTSNPSALCNISLSSFEKHICCQAMVLYMLTFLNELYTIPHSSNCFAPKNIIGEDLKAILSFDATEKQSNFSDVSLVATRSLVKEESSSQVPVKFFVHKAILAARSPVFAKMFEHEMQESLNSQVELSDIDPEVVKEMLVYIYTGEVPRIEEMANDLLYVADKYQLDRLKALCEQHLTYRLSVDNAARIIQLAYLHNAPDLRKNALRFISKHLAEVRATKEWEEVKQGNEMLDDLIEMFQEPAAKRPKTD